MENINTFLLSAILLMIIVLLIILVNAIKSGTKLINEQLRQIPVQFATIINNTTKLINEQMEQNKNEIIKVIQENKLEIVESRKSIIETLNKVTSIE